jgi:hypothetical protein
MFKQSFSINMQHRAAGGQIIKPVTEQLDQQKRHQCRDVDNQSIERKKRKKHHLSDDIDEKNQSSIDVEQQEIIMLIKIINEYFILNYARYEAKKILKDQLDFQKSDTIHINSQEASNFCQLTHGEQERFESFVDNLREFKSTNLKNEDVYQKLQDENKTILKNAKFSILTIIKNPKYNTNENQSAMYIIKHQQITEGSLKNQAQSNQNKSILTYLLICCISATISVIITAFYLKR